MTRRLLMRLVMAGIGLIGLAVIALAVIVATASGPELPAAPLPTATAHPGPRATPLLSSSPLPTVTAQPGPQATPLLSGPPLATATAQPGPASVPLSTASVGHPNDQVQMHAAEGLSQAVIQTNLAYEDPTQPRTLDPPCGRRGRWTLDVNPQSIVGRPYAAAPGPRDWARAANAVSIANAICPVETVLAWVGHSPNWPASDRWTAVLPAGNAAGIDGPTLQRFALQRARQV